MSGNSNKKDIEKGREEHNEKSAHEVICSTCGSPIFDLKEALSGYNKDPIHFDCAVQIIMDTEELASGERICYLGGGSFGIIKEMEKSADMPFFIRKRIQFETTEGPSEWRKTLSKNLSFKLGVE
jgi:hypothetical protein